MYPIIHVFKYSIQSFVLIQYIAFFIGVFIVLAEFNRKKIPIIYISFFPLFIFGMKIGSQFPRSIHLDFLGPVIWHRGMIFGLLLVFLATLIFKIRKSNIYKIFDIFGLILPIGYSIMRMGCFLAGDGCYGKPSNLFWAMSFPQGLNPINIPVHPTPIYEAIICLFIFIFLWINRKKSNLWVFTYFLILSGIERFFIEFLRSDKSILLNLVESQIVSIVLISFGLFLKYYISFLANVQKTLRGKYEIVK